MRNDISRQWALLTPFVTGEQLTAQARQSEAAGFGGIVVPQIFGTPFTALAHCAAVTERIPLASGILNAFAHSPFETACAAMDLDRLCGGRFTLGLGTGSRLWTQGYLGVDFDRPVARMRETVEVIRHVIRRGHTGELGRFDGDFHTHDWTGYQGPPPLRTDLPIWIGAFQPAMTRLAAEIADGVMTTLWTPEWTRTRGLPILLEGLASSGRERRDLHWQAVYYVAVNDDRAEAIEDVRLTISLYAARPELEPFFAAQGFGPAARAVQVAAASGGNPAAAVTDEMAEALVILGSPDDCRKRLEPIQDLADTFFLIPPIWGNPPEKVAAYATGIAETFYS